jgi:hypothetical protein
MFKFKSRLLGAGVFASATFFALAGVAQSSTILFQNADFIIYGSGANDLPTNLETKIFLVQSGATGTTSPPGGDGTLAENTTCSAGSACANFSSSSKIVLANGFSNITGFVAHGNPPPYYDLTFTVPGYKFGDFLFDVQLNNSKDNPEKLSITVNGATTFNVLTADLKASADLSFAVYAKSSFFITSVLLSSFNATDSLIGFNETKHFQVSDLEKLGGGGGQGQTPLPAALPLFATGLGALGLLGWRRKRKAAAAIASA